MFRILVADNLPAAVLDRYQDAEDLMIDNKAGISKEELMEILPQYQGLIVRSRTKVKADVLEHGQNLKIIGRAGAGVDNIDTAEATRRGIIVMNTPGGNTVAATEHTIALMLSMLRNIPRANSSMREGEWNRKAFLGQELYEKTVGVVGLGKIGREVAKRLRGFGVKLLGYDPILTRDMANRIGVELVDLETLFQRADIVTLHVPKMPETTNMVNSESLKLFKDGAIIVNCARGGIINEQDLIAALDSGKIARAAIDVYESEPPENWDLAKHPKVLATPHLGASTEEAQANVAEQILEQIQEYVHKDVALNAVNFVSVDEKIQPIIAPYFQLAHRLGSLYSQIQTERLKEVSIRFYGEAAVLPLEPMASHLMAGALQRKKGEHTGGNVDFLNMVNSMALAREKGVSIELSKKDTPLTSHTNLIACDFITEHGKMHLAGTVYARDLYRLVEFDKFSIDADLSGKLVMVKNNDVPGIIGHVGTILGVDHINIGQVSSGRNKDDKTAMNVFNVEGEFARGLQDNIVAEDQILRVWLIEL